MSRGRDEGGEGDGDDDDNFVEDGGVVLAVLERDRRPKILVHDATIMAPLLLLRAGPTKSLIGAIILFRDGRDAEMEIKCMDYCMHLYKCLLFE